MIRHDSRLYTSQLASSYAHSVASPLPPIGLHNHNRTRSSFFFFFCKYIVFIQTEFLRVIHCVRMLFYCRAVYL